MRIADNDKAREDRAIARDYQKKKVERRKNWLRSVIKLHREQIDIEPEEEEQIHVEENSLAGNLSPLKPQQLNLGSTLECSQLQPV